MDNVNSMRPDDETSLRALCEVPSVAQASILEGSRTNGKGRRESERVLKETVNEVKATASSEGGWRQNGRKRKRSKQGDLLGSTRCSWLAEGPKSRPAGVRASVVAKKRVMSVEPRDAGRWKGEEQNNGRQTNASARKGYAVAGAWPSAIDSVSTERLADTLVRATPARISPRNHRLESRMREIRPSGLEGGVARKRHPYPYRSQGSLVVSDAIPASLLGFDPAGGEANQLGGGPQIQL